MDKWLFKTGGLLTQMAFITGSIVHAFMIPYDQQYIHVQLTSRTLMQLLCSTAFPCQGWSREKWD